MATNENEAITSDEQMVDDKQDSAPAENDSAENHQEATTSDAANASANEKLEALQRERDEARRLQAQADKKLRREQAERRRLQRQLNPLGSNSQDSGSEDESAQTSSASEAEKAKAESAMIKLAFSDPKYREVLDKDKTLNRIISSNPLALVKDAIDAEDAVLQLQDFLDDRVNQLSEDGTNNSNSTTSKTQEQSTKTADTTATKEIRKPAVNPQSKETEDYKEHLKQGNLDGAMTSKMNNPKNWRQFGA